MWMAPAGLKSPLMEDGGNAEVGCEEVNTRGDQACQDWRELTRQAQVHQVYARVRAGVGSSDGPGPEPGGLVVTGRDGIGSLRLEARASSRPAARKPGILVQVVSAAPPGC